MRSRRPSAVARVARIGAAASVTIAAIAALAASALAGPAAPAAAATGTGGAPAWTPADSTAAARFMAGFVSMPGKIDSLVAGPGSFSREHDLGFGYRLREAWVNPAGKLGFALKIVYEGHSPVSFEVKPVLNYAALRARCAPLLAPIFRGNQEVTPAPGEAFPAYYWNLAAVAAPLAHDSLGPPPPHPSAEARKAMAFYMTPYSGIIYGIRGGEAGQLLENRDRFLSLSEVLIPEPGLARMVIRSLNPASRLTAAEFIMRHREAFADYEELQRTALAFVYAHPAKAATMRGANLVEEDPRKLVLEYARKEIRRDGRGVLRLY